MSPLHDCMVAVGSTLFFCSLCSPSSGIWGGGRGSLLGFKISSSSRVQVAASCSGWQASSGWLGPCASAVAGGHMTSLLPTWQWQRPSLLRLTQPRLGHSLIRSYTTKMLLTGANGLKAGAASPFNPHSDPANQANRFADLQTGPILLAIQHTSNNLKLFAILQ